ncbi:MAG TPA: acyl carrier protein [Tepidisphaeraceae bacterium]|nr:acyl carrier protein [Tepidisphaeraceae bacterium]
MAMTRDEVYAKVQQVLEDALGVDADEVKPDAALVDDLGMESIDALDIVFRLEKAFGIKIPRGELFPENLPELMQDQRFVVDGKITPDGMAELKKRMPFADLGPLEANPTVEQAKRLLNVGAVVSYVQSKLP